MSSVSDEGDVVRDGVRRGRVGVGSFEVTETVHL